MKKLLLLFYRSFFLLIFRQTNQVLPKKIGLFFLCCLSFGKIQAQAEVGNNDFRISDMGTNGNTNLDASEPCIAYNSTNNEYLVVWKGDNNTNNEYEIYGQRLAVDGTEIGTNDFLISDMGPVGNTNYGAQKPSVVYNSTDNEYLVVWIGDDDTAPLVNNEMEIFGQRLASDGTEIGVNDFRISDMGPNGNISYGVLGVLISAVYNFTNNQYLVVWIGDDDTAPLVDNEWEVFGQILAADGTEVGNNDFRISDMGPNGANNFSPVTPAVTFNPTFNNYLVVWSGDDDTGSLVVNESEIFGQRLSSAGAEIGTNDFRISDMGTDGDPDFDAGSPSVTYNTVSNEYFVVWSGDDNIAPLVEGELEIFGQRLSVVGSEVGLNDFRISDMGIDGQTADFANTPKVVYNATNNEYLVAWYGDDASANGQIHVQILTAAGTEMGINDYRVNENNWDTALYPNIAYNSSSNEYLTLWSMTSNILPFSFGEYEVFGQRLSANSVLPIELIEFSAESLNQSVDLSWTTASEIGNDYFLIEKSTDGKDFFVIGKVYSLGESNIEQYYFFEDKTPLLGENFYRLKQVDYSGESSYSAIRLVNLFSSHPEIQIYPNPAAHQFTLEMNLPQDSPVDIQLKDVLGRPIKTLFYNKNQEKGYQKFLFNIQDLAKGSYFIKININENTYAKSLFIR
ncbi:MAG: hypothetical protein ACI9JY_001916 [Saprospiraceae bacterium]|jgi:hypothetical protein